MRRNLGTRGLTMSERPSRRVAVQLAPRPAAIRPRILVVDDDPAIRTTMADILECEGYAVDTASNGLEALDRLEQAPPAAVLLDMRMPVLDGWGFMRKLRAKQIRLPVLVVTAAQNARAWAEEVGAQGFIAKPFDIADLVAELERVCQGAS